MSDRIRISTTQKVEILLTRNVIKADLLNQKDIIKHAIRYN